MTEKPADDLNYLLQKDVRDLIENILPSQQWLTLHHFWSDKRMHGAIFCAIVPLRLVKKALTAASWDLSPSESIGPACARHFKGRRSATEYYRFGDRDGIEPLIIPRAFHGVRPAYVEILEEFRLFHHLYYDYERDAYVKFDDAGNGQDVVRVQAREIVQVSKLHIRQFLALKRAALIVFLDYSRNSTIDIETVPAAERRVEVKTADRRYSFNAVKNNRDGWRSFSHLCGKRVLRPLRPKQSGVWPYSSAEEYPDFIVGVDENDSPVLRSCNQISTSASSAA